MNESIFWLVVLAIFLIVEIFTLGLTTIWFAGASLFAFIASLIGFGFTVQIIIFLLISFLLLYFTRPIAVKLLNRGTIKTNYESLIGRVAKVTAIIDNFNETGTAFLDGKEWTARAANNEVIEVGTKVRVLEIRGVKLIVEIVREEV